MGTDNQTGTIGPHDPYQFYAHVHGLAAADGLIRGRMLQLFNTLALAGSLTMGAYALTRAEPVEAGRWGLAAAAHVLGWRSQRWANRQYRAEVNTHFGTLQAQLQQTAGEAPAPATPFDPALPQEKHQAIGATESLRWRQAASHSSFAAIDLWAVGGSLASFALPGWGMAAQGLGVAFAALAAWQYSRLKQGPESLGRATVEHFLRDDEQMGVMQHYVKLQQGKVSLPLHVGTLLQARNRQMP